MFHMIKCLKRVLLKQPFLWILASKQAGAAQSYACSFGIHCRCANNPNLQLHPCKLSTCENKVHHICVSAYQGKDVSPDYIEQDSPYMCLACGRAEKNPTAAEKEVGFYSAFLMFHIRKFKKAFAKTTFLGNFRV